MKKIDFFFRYKNYLPVVIFQLDLKFLSRKTKKNISKIKNTE